MSDAIAGAIASRQRQREGRGDPRAGRIAGGVALGNLGLNVVNTGVGAYTSIKKLADEAAAREQAAEIERQKAALEERKFGLDRDKFEWEKSKPPDLSQKLAEFKYGQAMGINDPDEMIQERALRRKRAELGGVFPPTGIGPPAQMTDYDRALSYLAPLEKDDASYKLDPTSLAQQELLPFADMLQRIMTQEDKHAIPNEFRETVIGEILRRRLEGGASTPTSDEILQGIPNVKFEGVMGPAEGAENQRRQALRQLLWESIHGRGAYLGPPTP